MIFQLCINILIFYPNIYESVEYACWVTVMKVKRALISVSDKTGISDFSKQLHKLDIEIISTGGTAELLKKNDIPFIGISSITNFPEMLDGRVKTLHPHIHAGILACRSKKKHIETLKQLNIQPIDMVICNLYPFEKTIQKKKVLLEDVIENIDIGGPTLVRAAAKNYKDVIIVTDHHQYPDIISFLNKQGTLPLSERERLSLEAFSHTAQYDAIISNYLRTLWTNELMPNNNTIALRKKQDMRYGENPHLPGCFYQEIPDVKEPCITNSLQLQGKALSYNNILDSDAGIEAIKEFSDPTCVIIKHATPCGIASASRIIDAWKNAYKTDTYSPFGGIIVFNRSVDKAVANELSTLFLEVIIAPSYSKEALNVFEKKKNLRLLQLEGLDSSIDRKGMIYRSVVGGFLCQARDVTMTPASEWKIVTKKKPTKNQLQSMEFAVRCVKHIKSNSVVFVKDTQTVGIGGGQTARVDATWIATNKGKENIKGSILASDAFFPFRDAVDVASKAGVHAIIQPGGSIRDKEVINAADEHEIAMVFTGQRYFRH
jgi:phosphoribosylaminoimidazolecarboxamide formyltransferase / IMP cyclohydrolase